jgi:hypothetical protein
MTATLIVLSLAHNAVSREEEFSRTRADAVALANALQNPLRGIFVPPTIGASSSMIRSFHHPSTAAADIDRPAFQ